MGSFIIKPRTCINKVNRVHSDFIFTLKYVLVSPIECVQFLLNKKLGIL